MSRYFRESKFDLVLVAGPRADPWPSVGVTEMSRLVTDFGLEVAWVGGSDLRARGVIPLPGTGGIVIAEDSQQRIHRLEARSVVRWSPLPEIPDPFEGVATPGCIPGRTAVRLFREGRQSWAPAVALLGSSNRAFRFGSELLESGCPEVILIESLAQWGGKRYAGWEVEKRRFETLGGRVVEAVPISLARQSAAVFEFRIQDPRGVRLLEVSRVVSFGPFRPGEGIREYPPSSLLFEIDQSALERFEDDPNGWMLEEERAQLLGTRIVRALLPEVDRKKDLDFFARRSRSRLRRIEKHLEEPFSLSFQGKWTAGTALRTLKGFPGTPKSEHLNRPVASIECLETIGCNVCERACPADAIQIDRLRPKRDDEASVPLLIREDACTACGLCLQACPSATPSMIQENENRSLSRLTLAWREGDPLKAGEFATLLNRRGEVLGTARVIESKPLEPPKKGPKLRGEWITSVEVPTHLLWEARGIRRPKAHATALDRDFLNLEKKTELPAKVEVTMNGERRLVREKISISQALFETGQNRPNDRLQCVDGSCGLCEVEVDGIKSLACQSTIRKGMAIKLPRSSIAPKPDELCFCLGVTRSEFEERVKQGKLNTADAAFLSTHVGEGKCHGQLCFASAKRCLTDLGVAAESYVDWRFPWVDWKIDPAKLD